jgi:lysophospholipase L1-like esterase
VRLLRSILRAVALVLVNGLLGLLLFEAVLQVAASFVSRSARSQLPIAWMTGDVRVLCLGDSNTYGLHLERAEAYPRQLEALWNGRVGSPRLEVINLGFPGTNSSRLVRDLPALLETFAPDLVILMVGVNDFWTRPFPLESTREPWVDRLLRRSIVAKLVHLLSRGRDARELEIRMDPSADLVTGARYVARFGDREFDMGFVPERGGVPGAQRALAANLRTLASQARAAGTALQLLSYPARRDFYAPANRVIRGVARAVGIPFLDLEEVFAPRCPESDCGELLFEDGHPTAAGYRLVAETLVARLSDGGPGALATRPAPPR